jgi:hypothetical protein
MTIPGKGGRPRKWRSDADRVRAFRARQRGAPEPSVLLTVVDESDELAAAWDGVRELGEKLDRQRVVERSLRRELATARRELEAQQTRFQWLNDSNEALRSKLAAGDGERRELARRLTAQIAETEALRCQQDVWLAAESPSTAIGPSDERAGNRAQRRRAARNPKRGS